MAWALIGYYIIMKLKEIGVNVIIWVNLAQDSDYWDSIIGRVARISINQEVAGSISGTSTILKVN
jgi:hypothetical protein